MRALSIAIACFLLACGEPEELGYEQPLRVHDATLEEGALPGSPPGSDAAGPRITAIEVTNGTLLRGQTNRVITGRASADAYAIAVQLGEEGTGKYWSFPVGPVSPTFDGERTFEVIFDVSPTAPAGPSRLRFVAIGEDGAGGPQSDALFCVARDLPSGLDGCDPSIPPPAAILELRWHPHADVDFSVVGPSGVTVDARNPQDEESGARLTFDSNRECVIDGQNRELVVFTEPPSGTWLAYANLFSACRQPGAEVSLSLWRRVDNGDGTFDLVEEPRASAFLLAASANGGGGRALYLDAVEF